MYILTRICHGLWNQVDYGTIEYELLQEAYDSYQNEATTSISSLEQALDTWQTTIELNAGWNMFGYGCPTSIDLAEGHSNHTESIIITKDNNGNVYMPEFGFNGIGDFTPGFGYQIKVTDAIEGFSLCDWYVNDIPEDNIVSLQEENSNLLDSLSVLSAQIGCTDSLACNYDINKLFDDSSCEYAAEGYDCERNFTEYFVGMETDGGIVFYVDEAEGYALVANLNDLGWHKWGCGTLELGLTSTDLGTGNQNTLEILNCYDEYQSGAFVASQFVDDFGYSWYLPSLDELNLVYEVIHLSPNFMTYAENTFWSSSEYSQAAAWHVNFGSGEIANTSKGNLSLILPIRTIQF